jgi:hypothetical protein
VTSTLQPPQRPRILALALGGMLALISRDAVASGYYLLEGDLRAGVVEGVQIEGGLGLSLYSDELEALVTVGDTGLSGGRRVKEWWLASRRLGPVMGNLPPAMRAAGFEEEIRVGKQQLWIPFRSWSFGSDFTTGHWLEWDMSHHLLVNLASLTRINHSSLLFGPTVGAGVNLSWWEGWRGNDEQLINTGKITAEAGWVAGICLGDVGYTQARLLTWIDAFGLHQRQLRFAGVAGFSGVELGFPLGLELQWEIERGDDTVDALPGRTHTVMAGVTWRLMPASATERRDGIMDALRGLPETREPERSPPLPEESSPHDEREQATTGGGDQQSDPSEEPEGDPTGEAPGAPSPSGEPRAPSPAETSAPPESEEGDEAQERTPSGRQGPPL